jgi:phosphonate transport system substrate-binding protein
VIKWQTVGPLTFAVARSVDHRETPAALDRFGAQLRHDLGSPVILRVADTYGALADMLVRNEAQLAWMPPVLYVDTLSRIPLVPLLVAERAGRSEFCGVLFTYDGSRLNSLQDLRGSTVAWVDQESASGYLLPRAHLAAEGFNLKTLFARELFIGSHGGVVRAVFSGKADVGATFAGPPGDEDNARAGFGEFNDESGARVLFRTAPVPADLVACRAEVPVATRELLIATLSHLGTFSVGRRVTRRLFGADAFVPVDVDSIGRLRELVGAARARGWLDR